VTGPGEILLPPALARMPGAVVHEPGDTTARTVDHVDHPAGHEYAIHWADGGVTFAGARHPFVQETT
jgi:hypothetical protein